MTIAMPEDISLSYALSIGTTPSILLQTQPGTWFTARPLAFAASCNKKMLTTLTLAPVGYAIKVTIIPATSYHRWVLTNRNHARLSDERTK